MNPEIKHDLNHQMFMTLVEGGNAYLKYEQPFQNVLDYKETYVPKESRKQNIGSKLAEHALDFAREEDYEVIPSCPFVKSVINDNPEYKELVSDKSPD